MQRWRARIDFYTPARAIRSWEQELEAPTAEQAAAAAMQAFKRSRPGVHLPEIADFHLAPIEEG